MSGRQESGHRAGSGRHQRGDCCSSIDARKASDNPYMFVDLGVPLVFRTAYAAGARKERLVVKVAGGAATRVTGEDRFQIGKRNMIRLRESLLEERRPAGFA